MKLLTWNVQWGRGLDGRVDLARIVRKARDIADFDVLCVQEVADNFPGLEGNDASDQFAQLSALLPGYCRLDAFGVDIAGDGARRRRFGNALFTRYGVLAVRRHSLPWPPDGATNSMPRALVEATLQAPMGPIRVATTHLEYYSELQRRAQAARLRELHQESCRRVSSGPCDSGEHGTPYQATPQTRDAILAGDFNFQPGSPPYDDLVRPLDDALPGYQDAWCLANPGQPHPPTFCLYDPRYSKSPYCCDFVFVAGSLASRVRSVRVDREAKESDHQPVLVEIDDR